MIAALWKEATRHHIGPTTREGYSSILRAHIEPEFGQRRVSGIDAADIQRFANKLADRRSAKTARNVIVVLSAILDFAVVRKYIVVNPCSSIRVPTGRRQRKITPLPHKELSALADAMPDPSSRAVVLVAGYCGLRAGEVWALRKNDVLIRRLRVDEKITEADVAARDQGYTILPNGLAIGPTKTYTDEPVAMPEFVADALAGVIDADASPESFIFTDSEGGAMRQTNWYPRVFVPVARKVFPEWTDAAEQLAIARRAAEGKPELTPAQLAAISPIRFHDLRHTCAAYMIESGFHPKVIQTQMRHRSIQTTMDIYGHLFPDGLDAVADAMEAGYRQGLQGADERPKVRKLASS